MKDLKLKIKLNSLYGTFAEGEHPTPCITNNSRKLAGLPMFRKGKSRWRKYRGYRSPGAEALRALMEIWELYYIDADMVGGYHRGKKKGGK